MAAVEPAARHSSAIRFHRDTAPKPRHAATRQATPASIRSGSKSGMGKVLDEQGKINLDTAPPDLIANIFGVSQLARQRP